MASIYCLHIMKAPRVPQLSLQGTECSCGLMCCCYDSFEGVCSGPVSSCGFTHDCRSNSAKGCWTTCVHYAWITVRIAWYDCGEL